MAAAQSTSLRHWSRVIQRWPIDRLRPDHISFQKSMQSRIQKLTEPAPAAAAASVQAKAAPATAGESLKLSEQKESDQVHALYALLDDRFAKAYPIPEILRHPASNPEHYDNLLKEIEEAPDRSWFQNALLKAKNSFRLS